MAFDLPFFPQSLSVDALVRQLHTNVSGLDSQEAFRRLQAFGKNQLEEEDEASLTGESIPSGKDSSTIFPATTAPYDLINMVFAGTSIVRKMGKAIAVYTGRKTYFQG